MAYEGECALCRRSRQLCISHIIPRFTVDWLKSTYDERYLRQAVNPNVRLQDGPKAPLLCAECEQRLSKWETQFAGCVFTPFLQDGKRSFQYEEWLLQFAVSLVWRMAVYLQSCNHVESTPSLEDACSHWAEQLLGGTADQQQYQHHVFFLPGASNNLAANHVAARSCERYDRYVRATLDGDTPQMGPRTAVYVKLPHMVFWSCSYALSSTGWQGTLITDTGSIGSDQWVPDAFWIYLQRRADDIAYLNAQMSPHQKAKIVGARHTPQR